MTPAAVARSCWVSLLAFRQVAIRIGSSMAPIEQFSRDDVKMLSRSPCLTACQPMPPQSRPSGPYWPVDAGWKRSVRAEMKRLGISNAEMARRIGCQGSALTVIFRPETRQSRLVPLIHRELGRPPPSAVTASDEVLRRINNRWPDLTVEQRALVDSLVDQLVSGSKR